MALCFEITINGGATVVAGIEDLNVLTACVTYAASRQELDIHVGGLISKSPDDNEHVDWLEHDLKCGDEILIRIIESSRPAAPKSRRREDPEVVRSQKREYYERLKSQYESE
jgi:hypothetical protein